MSAQEASTRQAATLTVPVSGDGEYVRLHITPLDAELFQIIVPASARPGARNISFHAIQTFPEKRYGFVELPRMDADKIKKKLHGSVLKGTKIRIEHARPEKRPEPTGGASEPEKKRKKSTDEAKDKKKRKRELDVIEGVTLRDRQVKRGWTEPAGERKRSKKDKSKDGKDNKAEKRKRPKSKYTDQQECLLKVKMPLNAMGNLGPEDAHKKKRKKGNAREVTVHEFEKTTKFPSFLKNTAPETGSKPATDYAEGKGWVDEDGNMVEEVKMKTKAMARKASAARQEAIDESEEKGGKSEEQSDEDDTTSSSGTSSEGEDETDADEAMEHRPEQQEAEPDSGPGSASSSGSESDSESDSEDEVKGNVAPTKATPPSRAERSKPLSAVKAENTRPMSSSSSKSLTIKIPTPATPAAAGVHPLEALYKRAKPNEQAAEAPVAAEPFSFFTSEDNDDIEENEEPARQSAPTTPFTRQDIEWRNVRSAAPTPDTAHPSRMKKLWTSGEDDDDETGDGADADAEDGEAPAQGGDKTEFQSWFWENRSELNKSWMTRRKSASKEKRHRENKARASKAV